MMYQPSVASVDVAIAGRLQPKAKVYVVEGHGERLIESADLVKYVVAHR
jgi:hypothetical protein